MNIPNMIRLSSCNGHDKISLSNRFNLGQGE